MPCSQGKLRAFGLAMTLFLLAAGAGCTGFFVNPTLSSIAVGPQTQSIAQATTIQMVATGTYNDGSTQNLGGASLFWNSSDTTVATITTAGLVTGIGPGSVTITASSGAISGSTTLTVSLANITSITVAPSTTSTGLGDEVQFTATATTGAGTYDITDSAVWTVTNSNAGTIDSDGLFTASTSLTTTTTSTITAVSDGITGTATITVNPTQ